MTWWHRKTIRVDLLAVYVVAILLACLFLLWATARAEEQTVQAMPPDNLDRFQRLQERERVADPDCEQKMEAAMRAIEQHFYYTHNGRMIFPFKPEGEPIAGDVGPLIRQWEHVKRACWNKGSF